MHKASVQHAFDKLYDILDILTQLVESQSPSGVQWKTMLDSLHHYIMTLQPQYLDPLHDERKGTLEACGLTRSTEPLGYNLFFSHIPITFYRYSNTLQHTKHAVEEFYRGKYPVPKSRYDVKNRILFLASSYDGFLLQLSLLHEKLSATMSGKMHRGAFSKFLHDILPLIRRFREHTPDPYDQLHNALSGKNNIFWGKDKLARYKEDPFNFHTTVHHGRLLEIVHKMKLVMADKHAFESDRKMKLLKHVAERLAVLENKNNSFATALTIGEVRNEDLLSFQGTRDSFIHFYRIQLTKHYETRVIEAKKTYEPYLHFAVDAMVNDILLEHDVGLEQFDFAYSTLRTGRLHDEALNVFPKKSDDNPYFIRHLDRVLMDMKVTLRNLTRDREAGQQSSFEEWIRDTSRKDMVRMFNALASGTGASLMLTDLMYLVTEQMNVLYDKKKHYYEKHLADDKLRFYLIPITKAQVDQLYRHILGHVTHPGRVFTPLLRALGSHSSYDNHTPKDEVLVEIAEKCIPLIEGHIANEARDKIPPKIIRKITEAMLRYLYDQMTTILKQQVFVTDTEIKALIEQEMYINQTFISTMKQLTEEVKELESVFITKCSLC